MNEQTIEKLENLNLRGMATVFRRHVEKTPRESLEPEELVARMADAEENERESKRLGTRLRQARFKEQAAVEQIDWKHPRGLSKPELMEVIRGGWLQHHHNVLITGATGLGKTFLACAIGHKLCIDGHTVFFRRASRLFDELKQARGEGGYTNLIKRIARARLLIIDDFGLEPLDATARQDLHEIMEDRYSMASTLITSQFEPPAWHQLVGDATHADSILDRLTHNAHHVRLNGESIRKTKGKAALTAAKGSDK